MSLSLKYSVRLVWRYLWISVFLSTASFLSLVCCWHWFVSMVPVFCLMTISFFHLTLPLAFLSHLLSVFSFSCSFSPISLYRACSPPFTLSLTFRGTWWESNCPTELVGLLSYLHHAIVCVCVCVVMFASSLTSAMWLCSHPLRPHVS